MSPSGVPSDHWSHLNSQPPQICPIPPWTLRANTKGDASGRGLLDGGLGSHAAPDRRLSVTKTSGGHDWPPFTNGQTKATVPRARTVPAHQLGYLASSCSSFSTQNHGTALTHLAHGPYLHVRCDPGSRPARCSPTNPLPTYTTIEPGLVG